MKINIEKIESKEDKLVLELEKAIEEVVWFKLINGKQERIIDDTDVEIDGNIVTISLKKVLDTIEVEKDGKWKIVIEKNGNNISYTSKQIVELCKKDKMPLDLRFKQGRAIREVYDGENKHIFYPYFNTRGELFICIINDELSAIKNCLGRIIDVKFNKKSFGIKIEYPKCDFEYEKLVLSYRTAISSEKATIDMITDSVKKLDNTYIIEAHVDIDKCQFKARHWDILISVKKDEKSYYTDVKSKSSHLKNKLRSVFFKDIIDMGNDMVLFLHTTYKNSVSLMYRKRSPYDTTKFKIDERIAFIIYTLGKKYFEKKRIYLVYEKYCAMAQDNGYYFFKYCMDNNMEKQWKGKIYYVIDKNAPDRAKLAEYEDNIIDFMSIKYMVYMLAARLLISTDSKRHAYAWDKCGSILMGRVDNKKLVFLQHGVIAFKKVDSFGKNKIDSNELFIASSDAEKKIICDNLGYTDDDVVVTGLARWDVLEDKSDNSNEIMLVPTWRNYLEGVEDDRFTSSSYYRSYMELLNSDRLLEVLEKHNLKLNFYLHVKLKDYIGNFNANSDRIRLLSFGEEPLNEMMMKCRMLITDYSSVAWDVFHQNKPVLFYQFDLEEYNEAHGSYIDMETEMFGDRADNADTLINLIDEYAGNHFKLKDKYANMRENSYKYIDKNNSKRICEEIEKRGW